MTRLSHPMREPRRGYALVTVMIFLAISLVLVSISQRRLAAVLRVERARTQAELRDEGAVHALARALELLETGAPPTDPYDCVTDVDTLQGTRSFTVTYTSAGTDQWTVTASPTPAGPIPPAMPFTFAP